jgi:hypothetical protein
MFTFADFILYHENNVLLSLIRILNFQLSLEIQELGTTILFPHCEIMISLI